MGKLVAGLGALLVALIWSLSAAAFDVSKALDGEVAKPPAKVSCGPSHGDDLIVRVVVKNDEVMYSIFFNQKTKDALIVKHDADGNPVEVAFGKLTLDGEVVGFVVKAMMSADDALKIFPNPCDYLAPAKA